MQLIGNIHEIRGQAKKEEENTGNIGFELDEDEDFMNDVEGTAVQLIELVTTLVIQKSSKPIIRQSLYPIMNTLSHYLFLTQ